MLAASTLLLLCVCLPARAEDEEVMVMDSPSQQSLGQSVGVVYDTTGNAAHSDADHLPPVRIPLKIDPHKADQARRVVARAANQYELPPSLMLAYARHESGYNPFAVNVAGKSYQPDSVEAALEIIRQNPNASYDLGLMQINVQWLKKFNIPPEIAIKPEVNVSLAAWLINENLHTWGNTWKGLAAYHTNPDRNPDQAQRYMRLVAQYFAPSTTLAEAGQSATVNN